MPQLAVVLTQEPLPEMPRRFFFGQVVLMHEKVPVAVVELPVQSGVISPPRIEDALASSTSIADTAWIARPNRPKATMAEPQIALRRSPLIIVIVVPSEMTDDS